MIKKWFKLGGYFSSLKTFSLKLVNNFKALSTGQQLLLYGWFLGTYHLVIVPMQLACITSMPSIIGFFIALPAAIQTFIISLIPQPNICTFEKVVLATTNLLATFFFGGERLLVVRGDQLPALMVVCSWICSLLVLLEAFEGNPLSEEDGNLNPKSKGWVYDALDGLRILAMNSVWLSATLAVANGYLIPDAELILLLEQFLVDSGAMTPEIRELLYNYYLYESSIDGRGGINPSAKLSVEELQDAFEKLRGINQNVRETSPEWKAALSEARLPKMEDFEGPLSKEDASRLLDLYNTDKTKSLFRYGAVLVATGVIIVIHWFCS
jgi:hypothetical protein